MLHKNYKIEGKNGRKDREIANILNITITSTPKKELLNQLQERLVKITKITKPVFIATPNPEQILLTLKDEKFKNVLDSSDINIPDGSGLISAYNFLKKYSYSFPFSAFVYFFQGIVTGIETLWGRSDDSFKQIKGREFFLDLIKIADQYKLKVFLLGGEDGVAEKSAQYLSNKYKNISFNFYEGPMLNSSGFPINRIEEEKEQFALKMLNTFKPEILYVAFGAPKQEKWVYRHIQNLNTKIVMVVGGTFNYYASNSKLPPKFLENFEWLWRLIAEPFSRSSQNIRLKRIFNAVVVFPWTVFKYKLEKSKKR